MRLLSVMYHYFREETYPQGIYPVNKARFQHQLDILGKQYTFIGQSELIRWLTSKEFPDGNYCIITFDDGLKEQMEAFDILYRKGIPAIFYIPTQCLKRKSVLEVHKLHYIRTQLEDRDIFQILDKQYNISNYPFNEQTLAIQYRYDNILSRKLKYFINFTLNQEEKAKVINLLFKYVKEEETAYSSQLYMDEGDLKKLASNDALGAHGDTHIPLSQVDFEVAKKDVTRSVEYLEHLTQSKIKSFAYPYGGPTAVKEGLHNIFEDTTIDFAWTTSTGFNFIEQLQLDRPYYLRRVDTNDAPGGKNNSKEFCLSTSTP